MASKPLNPAAVRVLQADGASILLLFPDASLGRITAETINKSTDGAASFVGIVYELPMVINGDLDDTEATDTFGRDFRRVMVGRELVEIRDVKRTEDATGTFWTATALWAFPQTAPAAAQEA